MNSIFFILILLVILFFILFLMRKFKTPKVNSICVVNGGVKTGKTTFLVCLAIRKYKKQLRSVRFVNFFRKIFRKPLLELPLLYSNIPLAGISYVPMTEDLLLHKKRFAYRSVVILSEFSLVADSTLIKDKVLNNELLMFCKLFGHETHGGYCFIDSQCIADCHYAIKRVLSEYFYIHHITKWIPFFILAKVREDRYSDDSNVVNVNTEDVEFSLRSVIISKRTWKRFDSYCYSILFDSLPVEKQEVYNDYNASLKTDYIVSFNPMVKDYLKSAVNSSGEVNNNV